MDEREREKGPLCAQYTPATSVMESTDSESSRHIVIIGGGIIGAATAFYLTKRGYANVTVVERYRVAGCASGKSGGFLAGGWGDKTTNALHTKGFQLHASLSQELHLESYRPIRTLEVSQGQTKRSKQNVCPWLDGACGVPMDDQTAQVTPLELTTKLMEAAMAKGAKVVIGQVINVEAEEGPHREKTVTGVVLRDGHTLKCNQLLIAMGPWSVVAEDWFPGLKVPMEGIKSTSLILSQPAGSIEPYALFCAEDSRYHCHLEVYPRPNGEIYVCGLGGSEHCPKQRIVELTPESVLPDKTRVEAALRCVSSYSSTLGKSSADDANACMRPAVTDGYPMMGRIPDFQNAYIGTGHNCWGILWGPISGLALSELLIDGVSKTVSLDSFDPARFSPRKRPKHSVSKRGRHQNDKAVGEQW